MPSLAKFECSICGKRIATLRYLKKHEVNHSQLRTITEYGFDRKNYKCFEGCNISVHTSRSLREHLMQQHQLEMRTVSMEFSNFEEFHIWLKHESRTNNNKFVRPRGITKECNIEKYEYNCAKSGKIRRNSNEMLEHKKRKRRSCKLNFGCTSQIFVKKNITTGACSALYYSTHYGHDECLVRSSTVNFSQVSINNIEYIDYPDNVGNIDETDNVEYREDTHNLEYIDNTDNLEDTDNIEYINNTANAEYIKVTENVECQYETSTSNVNMVPNNDKAEIRVDNNLSESDDLIIEHSDLTEAIINEVAILKHNLVSNKYTKQMLENIFISLKGYNQLPLPLIDKRKVCSNEKLYLTKMPPATEVIKEILTEANSMSVNKIAVEHDHLYAIYNQN